MITILYDTASEFENVKYFINVAGACCDFSDSMTFEQCEKRECENCRQNFIEHCIISRTDYNSMKSLHSYVMAIQNIIDEALNDTDPEDFKELLDRIELLINDYKEDTNEGK